MFQIKKRLKTISLGILVLILISTARSSKKRSYLAKKPTIEINQQGKINIIGG
jgi:hypothetical protein